jgi:hypothetical protein
VNIDNARRLIATIPPDATVVDVGGGASPFPRADWVIDALPFDARGAGSGDDAHRSVDYPPRYARERWVQVDVCDRRPWPFPDKRFDFAVCSHLLEDLRDPIWVCSELRRVARAGYIEIPSRYVEQSKGVENPRHCGYYHHRWLVTAVGNRLDFRHKPHVLHSVDAAVVARLRPGQVINPRHAIVTLEWSGEFEAREVLEFDERAVVRELVDFARPARSVPDLVTRVPMPLLWKLKRNILYSRLARRGY